MRPILVILFSIVVHFSYGQLVTWNLGGPTPTNGREASVPATSVKEGLTVGDLTKGPLIRSKQGSARGFGGHLAKNVGSYEEAVKENAYFEFSVEVDKGYTASLSALRARLRIQEFSAKNFQWTYSLDGTAFKKLHEEVIQMDNLNNSGAYHPKLDLTNIKELQQVKSKEKITFRLYVWGNDNSQDKTKISVGFGKSSAKDNSPVLRLDGTVTKK